MTPMSSGMINPQMIMALIKALAPPPQAGPPSGLAGMMSPKPNPTPSPMPGQGLPPSMGQTSMGQIPAQVMALIKVLGQMAQGQGQGPMGGGNIQQ